MTAVVSTRCRWPGCGVELTDRFSRRVGYGSEHWKLLTPEQQVDALRANQPGYIPRAKSVSAHAAVTNAAARQAAKAPTEADLCGCGSGAIAGRCPPCNRAERDPMGVLADGVRRVIEEVRSERRAERDAAYAAWLAANGSPSNDLAKLEAGRVEQLTIGA